MGIMDETAPVASGGIGMNIQLLDVDAAAANLGVSPATVRRLVRAGTLAYVRIGDRVLFRPQDLESFIESCRISAK